MEERVEDALASGTLEGITTAAELTGAILALFDRSADARGAALDGLFGSGQDVLGPVSWDPTHDAAVLEAHPGVSFPLLLANDTGRADGQYAPLPLAVAGEDRPGLGRFIAFGGNPFRNSNDAALLNPAMHGLLERSIAWLTGAPFDALGRVVIAHLDDSHWFPDHPDTAQWLSTRLGRAVDANARLGCDAGALPTCLDTPPALLIISQSGGEGASAEAIEDITTTVHAARADGVPVLYVHHDGNLNPLGEALLGALGAGYQHDNYWPKLRISELSGQAVRAQRAEDLDAIETLVRHLAADDFSLSLGECEPGCDNLPAFAQEFGTGTDVVRDRLRDYDAAGVRLFEQDGHRLDRLLVLLADFYRGRWAFPMDSTQTDTGTFLRAYFADHAQYQLRDTVPVPAQLGNFSRTVFAGVEVVDRALSFVSRMPFRAAGLYALPGRTVEVRRTDASDVRTTVFVNTVRDSATHEFDPDGYKRPKFLRGQAIALPAGGRIRFASAYGGPIQVSYDANEYDVTLEFSGVAEHPYWSRPEDDARFAAALAEDRFDWAELSTPGFEVHSKRDKLLQSSANAYWPSPSALSQATMTYTFNYPHIVAGFRGDGIDTVAEIIDFAATHQLEVQTLEVVKHMNADQASCGSGCSGNPYDAYWVFDPIGHGDIHELGHGLERGIFRFPGWEGHSTTNPYSYYSKSRFHRETGNPPDCQKLPFEQLYGHLQAAADSPDATAYMANLGLTAWNLSVATYLQMMMAVQAEGVLADGFHLWGRLHIFERAYRQATADGSSWLAQRDRFGMGQYGHAQAQTIDNADWMLIALSRCAERDFRTFFDLYGLPHSATADAQVTAWGYASLPARFFGAHEDDFCLGLDKPTLPLDGVSAWPH